MSWKLTHRRSIAFGAVRDDVVVVVVLPGGAALVRCVLAAVAPLDRPTRPLPSPERRRRRQNDDDNDGNQVGRSVDDGALLLGVEHRQHSVGRCSWSLGRS